MSFLRLRGAGGIALIGLLLLGAGVAAAEDNVADRLKAIEDNGNILWVCLAAFLVFFMQAGFALVEAGMTRAKNVCNIMMKNLMDFSIGSLTFWMVGFGVMFGLSSNGFFGMSGFFFDPTTIVEGGETLAKSAGQSVGFSWAFLIFQTVFAATAATIISGAMAERTKFSSYLIYSVVITAFIYPIFGYWAWGNLYFGDANSPWLAGMGFVDFAGSTVVHSVGGWAALAGVLVLGPRLGKYKKDGSIRPIPGHNMAMATLGVFILWLGWFGFNPGSTTALGGDMARLAVTTNLSAATGAIFALITSWILFKKPDTSMAFNGALAGLVGITAGCANMTPVGAIAVGLVCGVAVVLAVMLFDKIRIDDPVGAISVHGVCGAIGTILVGLWGVEYGDDGITKIGLFNAGTAKVLKVQLIGVVAAFAFVFPLMFGVFYAIKKTVGLRVSEKEELEGLDLHEHGNQAYPVDVVGAPVQVAVPVPGGAAVTAPAPALRPSTGSAG